MGGKSSKQTSSSAPSRSRAMVLYDNRKAREAVQHTKSDFVDPRSLVDHLRPGDMIQKKGNLLYQWFYSHFAIYIGRGEVVHVTSPNNRGQGRAVIRRERMEDVFRGELVRKNNHLDNAPAFRSKIRESHKIVKAARDRVHESWDYNVVTHNCEHFATWCRYGREISLQSWGIGDLYSGKISFTEYFEHSVYSLKEKATTLWGWMKRKTMGIFDSIG